MQFNLLDDAMAMLLELNMAAFLYFAVADLFDPVAELVDTVAELVEATVPR